MVVHTTAVHFREILPNTTSTDADAAIIYDMRIACGWKSEAVPEWMKELEEGHRRMWFIHDQPLALGEGVTSAPIGMVALYLYDPLDLTLANLRAPPPSAGKRVEISSLFIYPSHRKRGIGATAIQYLEALAKELGAEVVTMNTSAADVVMSLYQRMGYAEYKPRERRYPIEVVAALGWSEDFCFAAFLDKKL